MADLGSSMAFAIGLVSVAGSISVYATKKIKQARKGNQTSRPAKKPLLLPSLVSSPSSQKSSDEDSVALSEIRAAYLARAGMEKSLWEKPRPLAQLDRLPCFNEGNEVHNRESQDSEVESEDFVKDEGEGKNEIICMDRLGPNDNSTRQSHRESGSSLNSFANSEVGNRDSFMSCNEFDFEQLGVVIGSGSRLGRFPAERVEFGTAI
ncbi:uncharacterized protein MELLADRAFT_103929 [Melampsora larici-populina 98AG31]|uniref:Uncharacterized protein n=1 Tax=Melampsora larici-populina (strain 98AG31 / pathotype 3-4-7) TaxID=747676 RepID=F4RD11_MELLP|nr:uncharacterized protein MELLADRAFT_103929 [Melampsora larici-populina 98AG31]EGG09895.1 hypothetical protein MELLADRAFT_103929 [Melampsora larici-populina 98AG31]